MELDGMLGDAPPRNGLVAQSSAILLELQFRVELAPDSEK